MVFNHRELTDFARYYGFHYDLCDPDVLVRDVLIDMERGLRGHPSDMPMIPAYISPRVHIPPGKRVIALDAGGTNLRAALVRFDERLQAQVEGAQKVPMPGTQGRLGKTEFFDRIAGVSAPLLEVAGEVEGIGFCFSYPMDIIAGAEGVLTSFSKEVDAPEVVGTRIGEELRNALIRRKVKVPQRIVLLNDTAAALLAGLAGIPLDEARLKGADRYGISAGGPVIGFILGTGFNTAYPETRIPKIGFHDETAPQVVVCESGNVHPRYLGLLDREYDAATKNPGTYTQEKACAGAYLGPLTLHILQRAVRDKALRFKKAGEFLAWQTLQTRDLNAFLRAPFSAEGPMGKLFDTDERDALSAAVYLASLLTERAALFSAAVVAAMVDRTGAGYDPAAPVRIAVEGTTYAAYHGLRRALESYLHAMLSRIGPRNYSIAPVEQASLFGAAVAALTG
jgi:hexokinase